MFEKAANEVKLVDIFNILELIAVCDAFLPLSSHFSRYVVLLGQKIDKLV